MELIIAITTIYLFWAFILDRIPTKYNPFTKVREQLEEQLDNSKQMETEELLSMLNSIRTPTPIDLIQPKWSTKKEYLKSPEWSTIRKERLLQDNYQCHMCQAEEALEVHHINYNTLYNEDLESLVSLCRQCHQATHDKHGYKGNSFPPVNYKD